MASKNSDLTAIIKRLDALDKRLANNATTEDLNQLFSDINDKLDKINDRLDKVEVNNSAEEKERQRSLVLIGLPESEEAKPSKRAKEDLMAVEDVLDELGVEGTPVSVYRMGRPGMERKGPRLLKVVMGASVFQRIALAQWKKNRARMREEVRWSRLLIRPSLSPEQLKLDKEERERRWMQKSGGGGDRGAEHVTQRK